MQGKRFWRAYCVFLAGSRGKCSEITSNKKLAVKTARLHSGEVRAIAWESWRECTWDYPTFYVCSEQVADFRQKGA